MLNGSDGVTNPAAASQRTDHTRWRLKDDRGCQTWHYLDSDEEVKAWPQSVADKHFLGMNTVSPRLARPSLRLPSCSQY